MRGLLVRSTWHSMVNWMVLARLHQLVVGSEVLKVRIWGIPPAGGSLL